VLSGKRVLVTAGPTREPLDPVRYLSNHSSGKMGVAIAAAAWRRGADVTLVAGPLAVPLPVGVVVQDVQSTQQMHDAVAQHAGSADLVVMAAAPADYRAAGIAQGKLRKTGQPRMLELHETEDILGSTQRLRKPGSTWIGFALETDDLIANASKKLERKGLDLIVLNDANEPGAGFGVDTNRVTFLARSGGEPERLPLMTKTDVADALLDRAERLMEDGRDGR
jgi:phosphopantothenoylcysteine decarboxylase/phosphopantothenate--cysteine ligase